MKKKFSSEMINCNNKCDVNQTDRVAQKCVPFNIKKLKPEVGELNYQ